jgi:hypothetical protein
MCGNESDGSAGWLGGLTAVRSDSVFVGHPAERMAKQTVPSIRDGRTK